MRRSIILPLLFIASMVSAQFSAEISTGFNIANIKLLDGELADNVSRSRVFWVLGVHANYSIGDKLMLSVPIQFNSKGSDRSNIASTELAVRYRYIDVMPSIHFMLYDRLWGYTGFNTGFLLSHQFKFGNSGWSGVEPNINRTVDNGLFLGLSYKFDDFAIRIHHYYGLSPIVKASLSNTHTRAAHRVWQLTAAVPLW